MTLLSSFPARWFVSKYRDFQKDNTGVVAIVFTLAAVPIAGLAGASLDYSRAADVRAVYQGAADAAALAAATSTASSFEAREAIAHAMFEANMPASGHALTRVDLLTHDMGYQVQASGVVDTTLLKIIGIDDISIGVSSVASAASDPLEITFVIDATRSMTFGSRWETAYDSLDTMLTALDLAIDRRDDFNITVVPMGDRVNIGLDRTDWVEGFAEDMGSVNDDDLLSSADWEGCVQPREEGARDNPFLLTDVPPSELTFEPFDHRGPSGTFTDREFECPLSIIGPSSDVYQIMRELDGIGGAGTGRFDQGLAWGWRSVSPNWVGEWGRDNYPAQEGDARKVVVFISDGNSSMEDHEFDGHSEWGYNNSGAAMFDNFAQVCEDMKEQGITIYTLYIEGNPYADEYFLACATSPAHYFDVTRNEDLEGAFNTMATSLMEPRLVY